MEYRHLDNETPFLLHDSGPGNDCICVFATQRNLEIMSQEWKLFLRWNVRHSSRALLSTAVHNSCSTFWRGNSGALCTIAKQNRTNLSKIFWRFEESPASNKFKALDDRFWASCNHCDSRIFRGGSINRLLLALATMCSEKSATPGFGIWAYEEHDGSLPWAYVA